jgi:hypothetical protein
MVVVGVVDEMRTHDVVIGVDDGNGVRQFILCLRVMRYYNSIEIFFQNELF